MVCLSNCQGCNITGGDYIISGFSPPSTANPGQLVTLNFAVNVNCSLCTNTSFWVCLYDAQNPSLCIASTGELNFTGVQTQIPVSLSYTQPSNKDFYGNLSLIKAGSVVTPNYCTDSVQFSVPTNYPPGTQRYSCSGTQCVPNMSGQYITPDCSNQCTGGGTTCKPEEIGILGVCLPKNVVFLGAALGLVYFMSK